MPEKPIKAELVKLEVSGAELLGDTWIATYALGGFVVIRAVTEPDTGVAHRLIQWTGGVPDERSPHDRRLVPLDQITGKGVPIVVQATLLDETLTASIIIPQLQDVAVTDAREFEPGTWYADYSADDAPVAVRVRLSPDTPEAYGHLTWKGGAVDPRHPDDRRLVPRDKVTPKDAPAIVEWSLNPIGRLAVVVGPSNVVLAVAHAGGAGDILSKGGSPTTHR